MKKKWQAPDLEVLNVRMTMKGPDNGDGPPKEPGEGDNPNDGFDS